jgi:uncharacterized protein YrrD
VHTFEGRRLFFCAQFRVGQHEMSSGYMSQMAEGRTVTPACRRTAQDEMLLEGLLP